MAARTGSFGVLDRKLERFEKARAEPPQDAVALGRRDKDVLLRHVGHGPDDGQHVIELLHADFAVDDGDALLAGLLGEPERGDRAAEQQQRLGHVLPGGLETSFIPVPRPAEQRAHVFLEHRERHVGEPGLKAGGLGHEHGRPPRRFQIGDVLHRHDRPFVDQAVEAGRDGFARRVRDRFPGRARIRGGRAARRCWRGRATPNNPAARQSGSGAVRDRSPAASECVPLGGGQTVRQDSKTFFRARARAASPIRSSTATVGRSTLFARKWAIIAWTIGSPRSVAQAASAPAFRQERQSANPKLRRRKSF